MPKTVTCVCGKRVSISAESPDAPLICPICGQVIDPHFDAANSPDVATELPDSAFQPTRSASSPPLWLRLLLDPTTIRRLLFFGGGLSVLGLIAWLISLGVFDDPRILAVALGTGSLALLGSGWGVALRSRHRLAGQALTFLACVVAPLNLWFYDAQGLLTVEGHLWVGALVCSLLNLATVWMLRDPLFLFAVEAGVTLTVMLLLGDLNRVTDSSSLCVALALLAAVSIHAEVAFDPNHPTFSRRRFGLPLFFSGQAQLAAGMISLLVLQILNWTLAPSAGDWSHSRLATTPWLAGGLWLAAAYLWFYSDLAVRKIGVYSYLAATALVFAEVTLLNDVLPVEGLIIALSLTALLVQLLTNSVGEQDSRWSTIIGSVGLLLGAVPFTIGLIRHFQHIIPGGIDGIPHPALFTAAMSTVAVSLCCQGLLMRRRTSYTLTGFWSCAGVSLWLGGMAAANSLGCHALMEQTPLLMLVPVAVMLIVPRMLKRDLSDAAVIAAHAMTVLGLILSAMSVSSINELSQVVLSGAQERVSLFTGLLFLELAVLYLSTGAVAGSVWVTRICGGIWTMLACWKLLVYVDLPEVWYGPLLAGVGVGLLAVGRLRLVEIDVTSQLETPQTADHEWSPWTAAGDLMLVLGELVAFFQTLPWLFGPIQTIPALSLTAVLITAGLSALGSLAATSRSVRGWHGFAAVMIIVAVTLAWIRGLRLEDYQKLEIALEVLGIALLAAGFIGRLKETDQHRDPGVSTALWLGSLAATLPVLVCTLYHRWYTGPLLGDELGLITVSALMVALGCVLQIRSTTTFGGVTLGIYLAVLFGHLAYHPQIAVGAYLAIGGAIIFLCGVMLSIYRDRLLALPSRIAHREGIFQVIDWR